jgi:hypothetical protein
MPARRIRPNATGEAAVPKLTVEFSDKLNGVLEQLSASTGLPKTRLIQRAIGLLKFAEDEREHGNRLTISGSDYQVLKEIVE